ncbi:MAG TPA: hypothetical protein VFA50_05700 [Stellaceae bacterium]|nr:hypothetical protein [Stellaceae bacterium]
MTHVAPIALSAGAARYLELVRPSAAARDRARRRCAALAGEGWRIVRIFRREPIGAADLVVTAAALTEAGVALHGAGAAPAIGAEIEAALTTRRAPLTLPTATASFAGTAG